MRNSRTRWSRTRRPTALLAMLATTAQAPAPAEPAPPIDAPPMALVLTPEVARASLDGTAGPSDPLAPYIRARGTTIVEGHPAAAELLIDGPSALYIRRIEKVPGVAGGRLVVPRDILLLLAERRSAFVWPALVEWGGGDLAKARALLVGQAGMLYRNGARGQASGTGARMAGQTAAATLNYAAALEAGGYRQAATKLLREAFDRLRAMPHPDGFDVSMLGIRLESRLMVRQPEAIAPLDAAIDAAVPASSPYYVNVLINRANMRARQGRFAEALDLIDRADESDRHSRTYNIAGTAPEFAGVRACALHGLGREDEANAALAAIPKSSESDHPFAQSGESIRVRTLICMRDAASLAPLVVKELADDRRPSRFLLNLQPAYVDEDPNAQTVLTALRADPAVAAAFATNARPLPQDFAAALNLWR